MRTLSALALLPLIAFGAPSTAYAAPVASPPPCAEATLAVAAEQVPPVAAGVVLVQVANQGGECTVDLFPSITFQGLDGTARPVPETSSAPYVLAGGATVYAALSTDDRSGNAVYVPSLTVAADPAHTGRTFTAEEIGAPAPGIAVSDPITTWWHATPDEALAALPPR